MAAINAEIVDSAMAMKTLTHFFLGLTNEWLESMSTMLDAEKADNAQGGATAAPKDSFPIQVSPLRRQDAVVGSGANGYALRSPHFSHVPRTS